MDPEAEARIRIGDWCVDPTAGTLSRGAETVRVEARTLRLLLDLAEHAGQVVSIDDLLERVWTGVIVTPDSVYQAVASLRRLLGDDPKRPRYIATVPRLGYRMVAKVAPWSDAPTTLSARNPRRFAVWGLATTAVVGGLGLIAFEGTRAPPAQPVAVGVLAFLDLTPSMDQEPLADDVTEGLIDRLSANPRLRTPSFRAAFQLKGKHASMAQAARTLGVAYLVDGSVRKEGPRVRIAARLVRADSGFVVWSHDYDRPLAEIPKVQDAIAAGVAGALKPPK
jgi:TolB-like protein/DNA-binding winged helix-turn-helix (wHTH) protein